MEAIGNLMTAYEIISGIGCVVQIALILLKRTNNILLTLGLLMDAVGLSGMSFGYLLSGEPLFAFFCIAGLVLDVAFILWILYKEEHPQKAAQK